MKIDRLLGILMMLIRKDKVTARQLSEYFEVSVRTIQRDMDTLMMAGIPLYADVGVNGGYQLLDSFRLEKGYLSREEASILFTFLKGLEGITPYSEVESLYNKFSSLNNHGLDHSRLIVQMYPDDNRSELKEYLSLLSKACIQQVKVKMSYYDVNFDKSNRVICPYSLALLSSTWYVYGYCDLRSDFRMFKVSRIADCQCTDETFELLPLPKQMPWDTEMDQSGQREEIILEIDRNLQGKLPDYFTPNNCQVFDDVIVAHLNFVINDWIYSQLMSLVPFVKVIKPDSLRHGFVERLMKSVHSNSPE